MDKKIAVISTGNGGQSMAAYFSNLGYRVALYAREQERVDMFPDNRFTVTGAVNCETTVDLISCDMGEVIKNAYLIMVTSPAQYHPIVAAAMAPYLVDGQAVVLNPGRTFGTYAFKKTLEQRGCTAKIILGETDTFAFTCRCIKIAHPEIYKIKGRVCIAAHNPDDLPYLHSILSELISTFIPVDSVLYTGFSNLGMVFHPMPILMNITRVEAKEDFLFYYDGISPLVAGILEKMDAERVAVAKAYGIDAPSAGQWLRDCYGTHGGTLYELIQNTQAYKTVLAPTDIDTRYVFEDIRTGCVPTSCAGRAAGVKTDAMDTVIKWASLLYNTDFAADGRNDKLLDFGSLLTSHT